MSIVVAVDGPCGSGKGTVTKKIQQQMGLMNLDTGITYRCIALEAINHQLTEKDTEKIIGLLDHIDIKIENGKEKDHVTLNDIDVTERIRDLDVTSVVSKISSIIPVREKMVLFQRKLVEGKDVIIEGRDIGTVVFPNADLKIYLDADVEIRAERRRKEYVAKGTNLSFEEVLQSIEQRDSEDYHKPYGALKMADDAILVDSSNKDIDEVVQEICDLITQIKQVKKR